MAAPTTKIEDYAFLSDTQTSARVSRDGCVDWLCFPRFDSGACFASLLGTRDNGHWRFWPKEKIDNTSRRYRGDALILETEIETKRGTVRLIDFMPPRGENPDLIRMVEGIRGEVAMQMELIIRFDYGRTTPWVRTAHGGLEAIAGPNGLILRTPVKTQGKDLTTVAEFTVEKGERVPFVLTWLPRTLNRRERSTPTTRCATRKDIGKNGRRVATAKLRGTPPWFARSSPLKVSLTRRPAGLLPRRPHLCPRKSAVCAIGIIAIAGCAMRRLLSSPWSAPVIRRRQRAGVNGFCARLPAAPIKCKSCTVCGENAVWKSSSFPGYRVTKIQNRCALATLPPVSFSSTSMARCWARCIGRTRPESKTVTPIGVCKSP